MTADYRNAALKSSLEQEFGTMVLGDVEKKVLVSTFDLDSGT